jgi:outer membrane biogenesis lipoprotein LolB
MKKSVALAFLASTLFLVACSTTHHQTTTKETKIVILAPDQADAELKKYAQDGWTCVGVITGTPVSPMDKQRGYMLER